MMAAGMIVPTFRLFPRSRYCNRGHSMLSYKGLDMHRERFPFGIAANNAIISTARSSALCVSRQPYSAASGFLFPRSHPHRTDSHSQCLHSLSTYERESVTTRTGVA